MKDTLARENPNRNSRRAFLGMLAGAFVVDPERLLWVPGRKTISIPNPILQPFYELEGLTFTLDQWYWKSARGICWYKDSVNPTPHIIARFPFGVLRDAYSPNAVS